MGIDIVFDGIVVGIGHVFLGKCTFGNGKINREL